MNLLKDGYGLGALLHSSLAKQAKALYSVILSKLTSVTPQRHCGFIVPKFCKGSQSLHLQGASVTATQTRLQSLYEGMTRQNKVLPNMSGGSSKPRVNPLTSIFTGDNLKNSKLLGGNHA
jgi:hypothetical protein